jgi:phospholipid-translocating ATPase
VKLLLEVQPALAMLYSDPLFFCMQLIVVAGMGPLAAIKYYRSTYRPNAINLLQQLERQHPMGVSVEASESSSSSARPVSSRANSSHGSVYEPLLSESLKNAIAVASSENFHKQVTSPDFLPSSPNFRTFSSKSLHE